MTSDDHESLLVREKPAYDGAEPSGNSVAVLNLLRLLEFTTDDSYRERADNALKAFHRNLTQRPTLLSEMFSEGVAEFIKKNLYQGGRLFRSYKDGMRKYNAYLDDYAFYIAALLDLYEVTHDIRWFNFAIELDKTLAKLNHLISGYG